MKKKILCFLTYLMVSSTAPANILTVPGNFSSIQAAILASSNGDTVLVEPGIYFENINLRGRKILLTSRYYLTEDTSFICSTILNGSQPIYPDTASCIILNSNEDSTTIIQGFTITGGAGTIWSDEHGAGNYREGGGILTAYSSPTIRNNHILNNWAINTTSVSSTGGGGLRCGDGHPNIYNNVIAYNKARYGAGIVFNYCANVVLKNNVISNNSGGQAYGGGGVWTNYCGLIKIENNTIVNNHVSGSGSAGGKAGGICVRSTSVQLKNNIVWGNTQSAGNSIRNFSGTLSISYSDIDFTYPGAGNIITNPLFDDSVGYYLSVGSTCVDAGDTSSSFEDRSNLSSLATYPSLGTNRNDMGAYGGPKAKIIPHCALLSLSTKKEQLAEEIIVYPNPASEFIRIESASEKIVQVELIHSSGFQSLSYATFDQTVKLNCGNLSPGIYFIKIVFSTHSLYKKIVLN